MIIFPSEWLKNAILSLHSLLKNERKIGIEILELLAQLEQKKAYAELGYNGLFTFCVGELKFTESQAFERIQAMRALNANPEIKAKLESGELNVTTVSKVQVFLRQEKLTGINRPHDQVKGLFEQIENKTVKEVKRTLAEISGVKICERLSLELDEELFALWIEAKALASNQSQGSDIRALAVILKEWIAAKKKSRLGAVQSDADRSIKVRSTEVAGDCQSRSSEVRVAQTDPSPVKLKVDPMHSCGTVTQVRSRYIPSQVKKRVAKRDRYQCTQCGLKYFIQYEHRVPFAKHGEQNFENLVLLCRSCNLHRGVKVFGTRVMKRA